jgi:hypothetical protein
MPAVLSNKTFLLGGNRVQARRDRSISGSLAMLAAMRRVRKGARRNRLARLVS